MTKEEAMEVFTAELGDYWEGDFELDGLGFYHDDGVYENESCFWIEKNNPKVPQALRVLADYLEGE